MTRRPAGHSLSVMTTATSGLWVLSLGSELLLYWRYRRGMGCQAVLYTAADKFHSFKTEVPENHKQFNSTKLQTTKYLLYRVHWGKDSSAWRWPGEVWKARREQATFATALVFILIEESDMLTNKVMEVLHYEPDTKASQVCAFKSQPGQDTPSQDLPTRH